MNIQSKLLVTGGLLFVALAAIFLFQPTDSKASCTITSQQGFAHHVDVAKDVFFREWLDGNGFSVDVTNMSDCNLDYFVTINGIDDQHPAPGYRLTQSSVIHTTPRNPNKTNSGMLVVPSCGKFQWDIETLVNGQEVTLAGRIVDRGPCTGSTPPPQSPASCTVTSQQAFAHRVNVAKDMFFRFWMDGNASSIDVANLSNCPLSYFLTINRIDDKHPAPGYRYSQTGIVHAASQAGKTNSGVAVIPACGKFQWDLETMVNGQEVTLAGEIIDRGPCQTSVPPPSQACVITKQAQFLNHVNTVKDMFYRFWIDGNASSIDVTNLSNCSLTYRLRIEPLDNQGGHGQSAFVTAGPQSGKTNSGVVLIPSCGRFRWTLETSEQALVSDVVNRGNICLTGAAIRCYTNADCGANGFVGGQFCQGNSVYQNFQTFTCNNPGTANATCTNNTLAQLRNTCFFNQTCQSGNCVNIGTSCTANAFQRCEGNAVYWFDSCGNRQALVQSCPAGCANNNACISGGQTQSTLSVTALVRNLSTGNLQWSGSVSASPSDIVQYSIAVQNTQNQAVNNVTVRDVLPANLIYQGSVTVDGNPNSSSVVSGINLGTILSGQTKTVTYQAQVGPSQNFPTLGSTTLSNSATVSSTDPGFVPPAPASAHVIVTRGTGGATLVPTGLTNNFWIDSFFLPLMLVLLAVWFFTSGTFKMPAWAMRMMGKKQGNAAEQISQDRIAAIQRAEIR